MVFLRLIFFTMLAGLQNVTFEFGSRVLLKDATWHIHPQERIGLIGYNGTGKSTLFKLLVGEYSPSAGTIERSRDTSIGYLHQDLLSFDTNDSILKVALGAFEKVLQLEAEIKELELEYEKAVAEHSSNLDDVGHLYAEKLHELEILGGYNIHHKAEEVLQGLGFANADLQRPYREFSGGWRMRVLLAKMILQQPDLLLLDEPTNHLDLPSIEWLEKYLQHYQGAVVIISHDRFFLNRMVNKIVELYQQQLHFYSGDYSFYETEKAQRMEVQQRAYENQQDYIRQQERFVERFKAKASKATQAQSIVKRLDKLERIENVKLERPDLRINFQAEKMPGKIICQLKNVSKFYGNIRIVEHASAEINRGDKIALIGANGKGKSTLLRIIGGIEAFDGERVPGHNVELSFYAQHQLEALDTSHTILEEMMTAGSKKTELELRTLLGCFLFSGDEVDKKIRVLSGGEKARVALAKTITSRANFMLLDEPTNHLDIHSVELLVEALQKYEGTYVLVSHDRYFISKAANKIWEIEDGLIKEFNGPYDEWAEWKERMKNHQITEDKRQQTQGQVSETAKSEEIKMKNEPAVKHEQLSVNPKVIDKEKQKAYRKQQKIFSDIEAKLASLKEQKQQLEDQLADPGIYAHKEKFLHTEQQYQQLQKEIIAVEKQYEEAFEKLMEMEANQ